MSVVELHPENLLSQELRGELDAGERQRLDAHLAECATCRLERKMRGDFAQLFEREAVSPKMADLVDMLANGAVATAKAAEESAASRRTRGSFISARRGGHRKLAWLLVAAALTVVAGAFAATEPGRRALAPLLQRIEAATGSPRSDAPAAARPRARVDVTLATVAKTPPPSPEAPVSALPATPVSVTPAEAVNVPASTAVAALTRASFRSAATLFAEELDARRTGNDARMLELHAQLVARYPESHEAQVSHMTISRILLDRGDSTGALNGFDAYLRTGSGTLREDALAGRASALDRLGRVDDAQRAWTELLDQYPDTAYAAHARTRIEAPGSR